MVKQVVSPAFVFMVSVPIALVLTVVTYINQPALVAREQLNLIGDHAYFRPWGDQVSGFNYSTVKYHRSPCPALNTLANHGYLPRDGKEVTPQLIQQALVKVYNIDASLAELLVSNLPAQFSLADLPSIEHDASLIHDDMWSGGDPASVNSTLVTDLLSRGNGDGHLTKMALAAYRREREAFSAANTPDFEEMFTFGQMLTAYSEPAVMLLVMGEQHSTSISVDRASTFLVEERIADDYHKPHEPVTLFQCLWLLLQLKALAVLSPVLAWIRAQS